MAELRPKKINLAEINNGQKYEDDSEIEANAINDPIEASAYAQALATNQPNIEEIANIGVPSVSIEEVDGLPRFKFANLKAKDGASIVSTEFIGKDANGGNVYKQTFSNGVTSSFTVPRGEKGDASATIQVGDVLTIESNENAEVENVGTSSSAVLNFKLPRGEKGEQGEQGNDKFDYSKMKWVTWSTTTPASSLKLNLEDGLYILCLRYKTSSAPTATIFTAMCNIYILAGAGDCDGTPFGSTSFIRYNTNGNYFSLYELTFSGDVETGYSLFWRIQSLYDAVFGYMKLGEISFPANL